MSLLLGVNIDHIATLRQARYTGLLHLPNAEPSALDAAQDAQAGGADSITLHVREDRRHMQDEDAFTVREHIPLPLNLEMANLPEMLALALKLRPDFVCLVPEKREEVTTEGGLDANGLYDEIAPSVETLQASGIKVSLFIDPEDAQIASAHRSGAAMIELHTGAFANHPPGPLRDAELSRLTAAATQGHDLGLQVNAGHGINLENLPQILTIPHLAELNIGHTLIARATRIGLQSAVQEMRRAMNQVTAIS